MIYRFDQFSLNAETAMFYHKAEVVQLEPRVLNLLIYLIENRHRIVTKEELFATLWTGRVVSDAALNTCIRSVRRALKDDAKKQKFIRTFPKRGFQFVAETHVKSVQKPIADKQKMAEPERPKRVGSLLLLGGLGLLLLAALLLYQTFQSPQSEGNSPLSQPSIAVLEFDNNATDEFQTYFSVGIIEELVASLSQYRQLFVIARNSSALIDKSVFSSQEIGKQLNAKYLLDGSLHYTDSRVQISARLIEARTGRQVWTEQFEHSFSETVTWQKELAHTIAGQLAPELDRVDVEANQKKPPEQLTAWSLYHKVRVKQAVYSKAMQLEAIHWATKALEKDSGLAAAHGVLARAKGVLFFYQWTEEPQLTLEEAIAHARQAIALDRYDPEAYAALGYVYRYTGDETSALANLKRATQLNPSDANIRLEYAHTLDWYRHQAEALPEIKLAIALSPRDPRLENMYFYKAHILFHLQEFDASLSATEAMSGVITSDTWRVFYNLIRAANFAQLGKQESANEAIKAALAIKPGLNLAAMRKQFENSKNHPDNRKFWLHSLELAGLPQH